MSFRGEENGSDTAAVGDRTRIPATNLQNGAEYVERHPAALTATRCGVSLLLRSFAADHRHHTNLCFCGSRSRLLPHTCMVI